MRNIIILMGALPLLSGCVTLPNLQKQFPKKQNTLVTPKEINTQKITSAKKPQPEINAVPVGKVAISETPDGKRDIMALSYMNNKKIKAPKNTNIYKPLMGYMGGNSNDIISLLGTPTRERNDPKVRVWQYRYILNGRHCWVDVYLYPKGGQYQAQYIELRGIKMSEKTRRECFAKKYKGQ